MLPVGGHGVHFGEACCFEVCMCRFKGGVARPSVFFEAGGHLFCPVSLPVLAALLPYSMATWPTFREVPATVAAVFATASDVSATVFSSFSSFPLARPYPLGTSPVFLEKSLGIFLVFRPFSTGGGIFCHGAAALVPRAFSVRAQNRPSF